MVSKWILPDGSRVKCEVVGCDRDVLAKHLCNAHYQAGWLDKEAGVLNSSFDVCPTPGCGRTKVKSGQICKKCNQFRWRYSLSVEDVLRLWADSRRVCSNLGCSSREDLHLDHDHKCCPRDRYPNSHKVSCGECVRGWLCRSCNLSLGRLQENPRIIQGLLDYLESFN